MLQCWGNVVAMKYLSHNRDSIPSITARPHSFSVTDYDSSDDQDAQSSTPLLSSLHSNDVIYNDYTQDDIAYGNRVFKHLLENCMYGYPDIYSRTHFKPLLEKILKTVSQRQTIEFMLPGFVCKCSDKDRKERVFGAHADFAEYLGLRTLVDTIQTINDVYPYGASVTVVADPRTFDVCDDICTKDCNSYQSNIKTMLCNMNADNLVKFFTRKQYEVVVECGAEAKCDCICISTYHHHPMSGIYPIDLYKRYNNNTKRCQLRTPWRHVVLYDSMTGSFVLDYKQHFATNEESSCSRTFTVQYQRSDWLFLRIHLADDQSESLLAHEDIAISLLRYGKGILIENISEKKFDSSLFHQTCLTWMIKEFGVVILRGFHRQTNDEEDDDAEFFSSRGRLDLVCLLQVNSSEPIVIEYIRLKLEPEPLPHRVCWEVEGKKRQQHRASARLTGPIKT